MRLPKFDGSPDYYGLVAQGFDAISSTYDAFEGENAINKRLRRRMQEALFQSFKAGSRVLEIGCGTGIDALVLAGSEVEVLATDISQRMVDLVEKKVADAGIRNLRCRRLAAHELGNLIDEFGEASFDGAFSHGGVLNLEPRLQETARHLGRLLRSRGRFICSVVNQTSLFELLFYPLVLRPRKAFRRLGHDVPVPITRQPAQRNYAVPARFYSPRAFIRYFDGEFVLRHLTGLQILLPPWNLADEYDRLAPVARIAESVEDRIADKPPVNAWGNLFLAEMERRDERC